MAKDFFSEARKLQDFDRSNSLGFALAGLWLESGLQLGRKLRGSCLVREVAQSVVEAKSASTIVAHDPSWLRSPSKQEQEPEQEAKLNPKLKPKARRSTKLAAVVLKAAKEAAKEVKTKDRKG